MDIHMKTIDEPLYELFTDDDLLLYDRVDRGYFVMLVYYRMYEEISRLKEIIGRLDGLQIGPNERVDFTVLSPKCLRKVHEFMDVQISRRAGPDWYVRVSNLDELDVAQVRDKQVGGEEEDSATDEFGSEESPADSSDDWDDGVLGDDWCESVAKMTLNNQLDEKNNPAPQSSSSSSSFMHLA